MSHFALQFHDFNAWANEQIFNRLKELPKDVYHQEVQSVFPSISGVMAHVYLSSKELEEMEAMFFELSGRYKSLLSQKENLDKHLIIENPAGGLMKTSVAELIPHVVNHGTYHRGNITAMLRQMGYASTSTDYGLYLFVKGE
jgi:uncharacterized damage-inducible protein DinB